MNKTNKLEGHVALITGASRGLGYAVTLGLANLGVHVLALSRTIGALEELADKVEQKKGNITLIPLDITCEKSLQSMGQSIYSRWGKLDILVHAAAVAPPMSPVTTISTKDLDRAIAVNTKATQRIIAMTDSLLKKSADSVAIFIDDSSDSNNSKFLGNYLSTKSAAREIVKAYASEAKRIGPRVILFKPQAMPTSLRKRFYPGENTVKLSTCKSEAQKLLNLINSSIN